jgi:E3 ubiquitin-protein ligase RNF14
MTADFRWCPASGCNSGQIHTTGVAGNIFTCSGCGSKTCVVHENTWHEGESCADFDSRISGRKQREQKAQEEASLKKIKELTRKCPGPGCDWNIQKNDGCDHMTCGFYLFQRKSFADDYRYKMWLRILLDLPL